MTTVAETVAAALEVGDGAVRELRAGELVLDATTAALPALADRAVSALDGRLTSLFASDERNATGRFLLHHVWSLPRLRAFLRIAAPIDPAGPTCTSIAAQHPAANWFEREVMDFFGVTPEGHPNPARVALHDDWPDGAWALRKDFPYDTAVPRVPGHFHPFRPVTGEGVFQIPVGPVHAGIIEPGHFRFGVAGEPVLYLQLRLFYVLITLLIDAGTFTDRVDGTGILSNQAARDLGVVGMAARASGVDADFRRDHPHDGYEALRFEVPVEAGGDVRARLMIRAREVEQSLLILHQVLDTMPDTPLIPPLPGQLPGRSSALGWVEAWRGPCTHWVATDERGELARVKVTDPSFQNWPGLAHAVPGNIVPDFPVINKSFNLSYSGNDR